MSEISEGIGWLLVEPDIAFGDGECQVCTNYMTSHLLPDHPALPAVAEWLAGDGRAELLRRVLSAAQDNPVLGDTDEAKAIWELFEALEDVG